MEKSMDREEETRELRAWLLSVQKTRYALAKIAERSLITQRALQGIMNGSTKAAQPSTVKALQSARRWFEKRKK
jgi:hypothetical protein